jgi:translation initiation factor eIF-2B subunit delta
VPTSKQPLTKAERRAKQEAERAAKAAAKAGGGGGGGGKGGGGGGKGGAAAAAGGAAAAAAAGAARAGATGTPSENRSASAGGASAGGAGASQQQQAAGATAAAAAPTATAAATPRAPSAPPPPGLELFAHLPPYRRATPATVLAASASTASSTAGPVHPAVLALALRYADGTVSGGDARCLALLEALSAAIRDYRTPEGRSLRHHLTATVNAAIDLLVRSRPLSAPMGNAVKLLKLHIGRLDPSQPEDAAKEGLLALLQEYAHEKIVYARRVLVQHAVSKVRAGDVVLTYGYSSTVVDALLAAHAQGVAFSAVVVDGRPDLEGRAALSRLLAAGIPCTYAALSGLALVTRQATKVMLGASAVLSNGAVLARAGTASVALAAHSAGVPVLVLTASHKFHERVQLDSITHNELGDPEALAHLPFGSSGPAAAVPVAAAPTADEDAGGKSGGGKGGGSSAAEAESAANNGVSAILGASGGDLRDAAARAATLAPADRLLAGPRSAALAARPLPPRLGLLNLRYDLTPADLVTVVTTEFGHLPPTSVPVILREFTESAADAAGGGGGGGGGGHGHGHHHHGR